MDRMLLKLYAVSMILGILTGLVGSLFQLAIARLDKLISQLYLFLVPMGYLAGVITGLLSMLMVFIAWLTVKYIAPEAAGSGVPEIEGRLLHLRPIFWRRLLPVKFFSGILAISSKLVLGREGPTIQIGGNLGDMLAELISASPLRRNSLIAAGAAAGLATAFNAPLAGVLFVMEEMRSQFNYSFTNFKVVLIACVSATIVLHWMIGSQPAIVMPVYELPGLRSMALFFVFGIGVGFVGLLFNLGLMALLKYLDRLSNNLKLAYVLFIGFGAGFLAYYYPSSVGGGYQIIDQILDVSPSILVLGALIIVRFCTSLLSYATGVPGGIFAPMLALGTLLGLAAFYVLHWLPIDFTIHAAMFAVAGMGALFAATVRAPITGVVLVVEMTQNYSLILPMMITCITSTTVMQLAKNKPIYTQLLLRARS